jgi:hypothetical protein
MSVGQMLIDQKMWNSRIWHWLYDTKIVKKYEVAYHQQYDNTYKGFTYNDFTYNDFTSNINKHNITYNWS